MIHVGDGMSEEDLKTAGKGAEGLYAAQIWVDSPRLKSAYERRFGADANALHLGLVAIGYDWVKHVQGAAKQLRDQGKVVSRKTLGEALLTFRSEGYLGQQMYGAAPLASGEKTMIVRYSRYVPVE